jgi:hypothetical protein
MKIIVCDKIHAPVITQRQRRFIQDSEQQLPKGITRLLDLVKEQKTQL